MLCIEPQLSSRLVGFIRFKEPLSKELIWFQTKQLLSIWTYIFIFFFHSLSLPSLANFPDSVVDNLPTDISTGIYYGWACVGNGDVHKMVMSIGWNPYYKNTKKSMVSTRKVALTADCLIKRKYLNRKKKLNTKVEVSVHSKKHHEGLHGWASNCRKAVGKGEKNIVK